MKLNLLNLLVLGSALTMTAVGCKTHPYHPKVLFGDKPPVGDINRFEQNPVINNVPPITDRPPVSPNDTSIPQGPGHTSWNADPSSPLRAQTIYFEFDKSSVKTSEQSKLEEVASYMKSHPDVALKIEGNCDERGTEEYNRSLGERRANAAREYLAHLGIDASKVDTISYGEDKPATQGHNEAAWSKNRRDDFVVLLPPKL